MKHKNDFDFDRYCRQQNLFDMMDEEDKVMAECLYDNNAEEFKDDIYDLDDSDDSDLDDD